jgi:pyruvate kinase
VNQLSLSWGVRAFYYDEEESLDEIFQDQIEILKKRGFLKEGDVIVSTGSTPIHLHLPTNVIKIDRVK